MSANYVLFFDRTEGDFVFLKLIFFHWTFLDTSLSDVLEKAGVEVPDEYQALLEVIEEMEVSPTPAPLNPIIAPSIRDFMSMCPFSLEQGLPFPKYNGNALPGLILNPGGAVVYEEIPFDCRLMDLIYNGLGIFLQSGGVNLDASLVTQVSLCYRRSSLAAKKRPGLNLANYVFRGKDGELLFYTPVNQGSGCGDTSPIAGYMESGQEIYHWMCPLMPFPDVEGTPDELPSWHFLTGDYKFDFSGIKNALGVVIPLFSNLSWQYGSQYPGAVSGVYPSSGYLTSQGYERIVSPVGFSVQIIRDFGVESCFFPSPFTDSQPGYIINGGEFEQEGYAGGLSLAATRLFAGFL